MPAPFTDVDVLTVAPFGANGVTVTPSSTAWAPSAWVEITPTTATPWVLVGVNLVPPSLSAVDAEIDVGIGSAGSEVPIATYSARTGSAGCTLFGHTDHWSSILIDRIPALARVTVRLRKSGTSTTAWGIKVAYYAGPVTGSYNLTTHQSPFRIPTAAAAVTVTTPASAWGNSAYGVLHAALPSAVVVLGANIELSGNGPRFEVDLATGTASAESVFATLWEVSGNVSQGLCWFPLHTPLGPLPAGARLACRARSSSGSAVSITVSVLVLPHPY